MEMSKLEKESRRPPEGRRACTIILTNVSLGQLLECIVGAPACTANRSQTQSEQQVKDRIRSDLSPR